MVRAIALIVLVYCMHGSVCGQENVKTVGVYTIVDKEASYPGGEKALSRFLVSNIIYPRRAQKKNIEGTVLIQFIVKKNGGIEKAKILKGIGGGCDVEALRVVKEMPNWNPGEQDGVAVDMFFTLPISFSL